MKHDIEITADQILVGRAPAISPCPVPDDASRTVSASEVVEAFRVRFGKACDGGVGQRLSNAVLEPANPFAGKSHRRVRREAIVLGTLVLAALALTVYFNLNALMR